MSENDQLKNQGDSIYVMPAGKEALRLDAALGIFLSHGLRARRRLIERGLVEVNGQLRNAAFRIRGGDRIKVLHPEKAEADKTGSLIGIKGDFCAFYKPAGLHSASLPGLQTKSLESQAETILNSQGNFARPTLLQRLDYGTSGIICGAFRPEAISLFREAEKNASCEKYYLALLSGMLKDPAIVRNALDANGRAHVRILAKSGPATGWTSFRPIWSWSNASEVEKILSIALHAPQGVTLAQCKINKGQRHQIRAHAKAAGHSLCGDPVYGDGRKNEFFLTHYFLKFPGCEFRFLHRNGWGWKLLRWLLKKGCLSLPGDCSWPGQAV